MNKSFKYFKETDSLEYEFIKTPKAILHNKKYSSISPAAKLLYLAMLERQSLSLKNNLKDKEGNVYIIFTHEDAREVIGCGVNKAVKAFSELDTVSGAGLIKRKRQGLCRPDLIYLNSEILNESEPNVDKELIKLQKEKTGILKMKAQMISKIKLRSFPKHKLIILKRKILK